MSPNEPDGIEDALRRELKSQLVPFDGDRADEMVRSAASASLTGRGWVAPLAAAAVVVVVGGGVALATARGGDGSSAGPAAGPGVSTTGDDNNAPDECAPMSDGSIVVGTASAGPGSPTGHYTAYPVETGTADAASGSPPASSSPASEPPSSTPASPASPPPPDATVSAESGGGSYQPVYELPTVDPSAVPTTVPDDTIVICAVDPASGIPIHVGECTTHRNATICMGTDGCSTLESSSDGPDNSVVCIATASDLPLPNPPTGGASGPGVISGTCDPSGGCPSSSAPPNDPEAFTVAATVPAGESRTFRGPDIPAGKNLLVGALVFQNPAADTGTVTVQRGGEDLLHEGLADFRDLDVHYDNAPLVFDADHPVRVTVDCTNANADCTPSVLFDGKYVQVQN